jgi:hypothetical protein
LKNSKKILVILLAFLLALALLPATALAADFPLKFGDMLVADDNSKYVTLFEQDPVSKVITGTVQIVNGGKGDLTLNGIGIVISFDGSVTPCNADGTILFSGRDLTAEDTVEFSKYCKPLRNSDGFSKTRDILMRRDNSGGLLSTKLASDNGALKIPAEQTISLIEFYFKPINGTSPINDSMFNYKYVFEEGIDRYATWFGYGSYYVQATRANIGLAIFVESPSSFKLHLRPPAPDVTANTSTRSVDRYDSATMEWSKSEIGPFSSNTPTNNDIGDNWTTIFVRVKESSYFGSDSLYGNYKKFVPSKVTQLDFPPADPSSYYTVIFDAAGGNFSNNVITETRYPTRNSTVGSNMPSNPSRDGFQFIGWEDGFTSTTPVTRNMHVRAQWRDLTAPPIVTPTTLTVTFFNNDGTLASVTRTITLSGGATGGYVTSLPTPTRLGYSLLGWNFSANGTGGAFTTSTWVTQNVSVFAQWQLIIGGGIPGTTIPNGQVPTGQRPPGFLEDHIPFITGYPDNSVRPDNHITRAEVAMIFFRLLSNPEKNNPRASVFSDVGDKWYTQAVNYLASIEILTGYPEGTFLPDRSISRAEFAAVASRFDKLAVMDGGAAFPDIEGHWAKEYINSAFAKGWVSGYPEGTFKPQQNITRAEVVKVVNTMLERRLRVADMPADILANIVKFTDFEGHWAYSEIVEASNNHDYTRRSDGYETWTRLK